jgi:hypothetical protein
MTDDNVKSENGEQTNTIEKNDNNIEINNDIKAYSLKDEIEDKLIKKNFEDWDKYSISFLVSIFQYKQYEEFYEGNLSLLKKYIDWARNNQDKVYGKNMYKYDILVKIYHMINDDLFYNRKYDHRIDLNNLEMKDKFFNNSYGGFSFFNTSNNLNIDDCHTNFYKNYDDYFSYVFDFSSGFFMFTTVVLIIILVIALFKKFVSLIYKKTIFRQQIQNIKSIEYPIGSINLNKIIDFFFKYIYDSYSIQQPKPQLEKKPEIISPFSFLNDIFNKNIEEYKDKDDDKDNINLLNSNDNSSKNDLFNNDKLIDILKNIKDNFTPLHTILKT